MDDEKPIEPILTDEHFRTIGVIIVQWAVVERLCTNALVKLLGGDVDDSFIVVNGMAARVKIGLLKTLIYRNHNEQARAFDKLAAKLEKQLQQRDIFAHATWTKGATPNHIRPIAVKTVGSIRILDAELTPGQIEKLAYHIAVSCESFIDFFKALDFDVVSLQ